MKEFTIPSEKVEGVYRRIMDEVRERTRAHMKLPDGEGCTMEFVSGVSWSGYHRYLGGFKSLMQINRDSLRTMAFVDAVSTVAHELYPGHHTFRWLIDEQFSKKLGWREYCLALLFAPTAPLVEGTAELGARMIFSTEELQAFERDVLFPLAGLSTERIQVMWRLRELFGSLGPFWDSALQRFLDGVLSKEEALEQLKRFLRPSPENLLVFAQKYGPYSGLYSVATQQIWHFIVAQAGDDREARWKVYEGLLRSIPSHLQNGI